MKIAACVLLGVSLLSLSGCWGQVQEIENEGRYWQRIDATDAIYQRGPKVQQMLFQDIANCTSSLRELERLDGVRNAVPPETFDRNYNHVNPDSPEGRMARYDSPDRNGYLRNENYDYHDFESCMNFKGWQRTKYVNPETQERARDEYLDAIGYQRFRSTTNDQVHSDYGHLNQ